MKHRIIIPTLIACVLAAPLLHAQNSKNLSLDEAIQLSLKTSGQLKLDKAKVDEAIANYKEMWNNHLPDAKITGTYMRISNPDVKLKVKLGGGSSDSTSQGGSSSLKINEVAYGMANVSLPLFAGFRIKYGVEAAKYLEEAAKLDGEKDKEEVILNTIRAYSTLYKASKAVELVKENLRQQKQRVADFSNLERNGLLARNDLLKAQLQQSNIELSLLDAENDFAQTYTTMDFMLGLPEGTELIPDSTGFDAPADAGGIAQWEDLALKNRKDIAALTFREKATTANIRSIKGEYYPSVALTGGYIAADVPNFVTITNAVNIGIGLQYNLGSLWKTGAKIDVAKAKLHQVQATQGMLNDQIKIDVNQAYRAYLLSVQKIAVYAKSIEQANENYRITKNKYDNNLVTTTDLLEADVAQLQAKLNYANAKADAFTTYRKLQQVSGTLK